MLRKHGKVGDTERLSLEDRELFASYRGLREIASQVAGTTCAETWNLSDRLWRSKDPQKPVNLPHSWPRSPRQFFSKQFVFQYEAENSRYTCCLLGWPFPIHSAVNVTSHFLNSHSVGLLFLVLVQHWSCREKWWLESGCLLGVGNTVNNILFYF